MRGNRLVILAGSLILFVVIVVLVLNAPAKEEGDQPKNKDAYFSNKWVERYGWENLHPNGLYVFNELVNKSKQFEEVYYVKNYRLLDSLLQEDSAAFAFIGDNFYLTNDEISALMASVGRGSQLFYSCDVMDYNLHGQLLSFSDYKYVYDKEVVLQKDTSQIRLARRVEGDTVYSKWNVFDTTNFFGFTSQLSLKGYPFSIEMNYGVGKIFGHLNPESFFNYQLKTAEGFKHYQATFGKMKAKKLYFLEFANYDPEIEPDRNSEEENESLFKPLLKYPSFKWALFTFIIGFIAFMLFRSKRERPIIRIRDEKQLSTLSYVDTIAGIYFDRKQPEDAYKMMKANFYVNVQKYFYLDLKNEKEKGNVLLSEKANMPLAEVDYLLSLVESKKEISFQDLETLNNELRKFYLQSEIWKEEEQAKIEESYHTLNRGLFTPSLLMVFGALDIAASFMLLTYSVGGGILLWPTAIMSFVWANRMLTRPIMRYNAFEIILYPLFGKEVKLKMEDVYQAKNTGKGLVLKVIDQEDVEVSLLHLDKRNIKLLESLVFQINNKGNDRRK
ncbi:hypothetical protein SAMN05216474_1553 [Lishizhenia tianjinensis]|uniref:DUF4350 domain-containing protein n=1 Tax=Lishizhenia tianjinensis TaxID=477690 RepID=A0A1I6ZQS3_9FLAO|nr:hypothetical protein [Lishizhenia tianjinensis]SFT65063.1 hypothetical protein SAMN05216474_1553 [Lishizhenia tianjinensis]